MVVSLLVRLDAKIDREHCWQKIEEIVSGFGGGACGTNDGAIVLLQDIEPGAEAVGMAHRWHDAEQSADKGGRHSAPSRGSEPQR